MHYPESKLPKVGTTIFSVMSHLAAQHDAVNLSQGFPDFEGPELMRERVAFYMANGANQYAPMTGAEPLRAAIAEKVQRLYGYSACSEKEVTITSGATEAIFAAISAVVRQGDEVVVFDPAYDCYEPAIELNGGICRHLPLSLPDFSINWDLLKDTLSPRTRMIIVNTPHNPSGATLSRTDLDLLAELIRDTHILLLGDEVYEHIVFDQQPHNSLLCHSELAARSFVVSSFGKTYHTTGWKVGYCIAPEPLTTELRKVHQYLTFSTATPFQLAIADYMQQHPEYTTALPGFYQEKRDLFCQLLQSSSFDFSPTKGTYFQLVDYSRISEMDDVSFARWLTSEKGVAAIPVSVFCEQPVPDMKLVRFCFAKGEQTLHLAGERLSQL
ncbi:pyridoxal phosphate-dependent aminotransferase [Oceanospirillum sediminis]|uniref:Pyridoxal phosphate-dependent aminotransferase n=1 Tax=Oceanospirillum sediminis TaxID=2760088 RepID=A0A839ITE6_9GAMM|nr:pyridoxal phosphate-dependent aminotransferase [Oceanospirillum sediminis]MBB1487912.1 pyridoxal phosphate-dependent aminotransferase [Oceanospirillum sediminis]